jgi:TRAP-type C4-dicarboxylate transport system permease small subunit
VTAATRAGTHLAVDTLAKRYPLWLRRPLARVCDVVALGPWALFVLAAGTPMIVSSIDHWERFPDTGNYFIIKASLWLMAGAVLASIALGLLRAGDRDKV